MLSKVFLTRSLPHVSRGTRFDELPNCHFSPSLANFFWKFSRPRLDPVFTPDIIMVVENCAFLVNRTVSPSAATEILAVKNSVCKVSLKRFFLNAEAPLTKPKTKITTWIEERHSGVKFTDELWRCRLAGGLRDSLKPRWTRILIQIKYINNSKTKYARQI